MGGHARQSAELASALQAPNEALVCQGSAWTPAHWVSWNCTLPYIEEGQTAQHRIGAMFSDAMTMRVMADKYCRLAEQQKGPKERDKYRAYARIYSEMALRFDSRNEPAGPGAALTTDQVRKQAQGIR
jgi:hypothetical protein